MTALRKLFSYFRTPIWSGVERRVEANEERAMSVAEANRRAARQLLAAERAHLETAFEAAWAREDFRACEQVQDELDRLDVLERAS